MKQILIVLALMMPMFLNAQIKVEKVETINNVHSLIPPEFCANKKAIIICGNVSDDDGKLSYSIYDSKMKLMRNFKRDRELYTREYKFYDYDKGADYSAIINVTFTQTLFNDDEKLEYIVSGYSDPNNSDTWGLHVINEDGKFLYKLDFDGHEVKCIMKLDGEYYFMTNGPLFFYKITKDNSSTGANALTITKTENAPTQYFDLTGKSVTPDTAKGQVIIKTDGNGSQKILMK